MSTATTADPPEPAARRRRSRAWIGWTVLVVVVLLIVVAAWIAVRGLLAVNELRAALPAASRIQTAVTGGDTARAKSLSRQLTDHADRAHRLTSDPIWRLVEKVPGLGPNLEAIDDVSTSAATFADGGLAELVGVSDTLNAKTLAPKGGVLQLQPLAKAAPQLAKADTAVQKAAAQASAADTTHVIGPLASAVSDYRTKITSVAGFTDAAARGAKLLPAMLPPNGTRHYLVLILNNAELRSTGGIPGSVAHITVTNGKIDFDKQVAGSAFGPYDGPIVPLDNATSQLYSEITGEYMMDVTLTPHFDQSAKLAVAMWKQKFGGDIDGVLSLDPVALKYILKATGPVSVAPGTPMQTQLTSDNVVTTLLSDVYAKFSVPEQQDEFFQAASGAVFQKVATGDYNSQTMLQQFAKIGDERRLNVWSAHADEQKRLAETTLAGSPPRSAKGEQRFGIYLADGTGSKMDFYLTTKVELGQPTCSPAGALYVAQVTLTNTLKPDQVPSLPAYVSGDAAYGVAIGTVRTQVTVYGSPGVQFGNGFKGTGGAEAVKLVKDHGRSAVQYVADIKPGESSTVRLVYTANKGTTGRMTADVTPQINPVAISTRKFDCAKVLK